TQVVLDDLLGSSDFLGDVLVLHALGYTGDDLELFLAEARLVARSHELGSLGAISLDDPVHAAIIEPCFPGMHFADAANQEVGRNGTGKNAGDPATKKVTRIVLAELIPYGDDLGFWGFFNDLGDRF